MESLFLQSLFLQQQQGTVLPAACCLWGAFSLMKKAKSEVYQVLMEK